MKKRNFRTILMHFFLIFIFLPVYLYAEDLNQIADSEKTADNIITAQKPDEEEASEKKDEEKKEEQGDSLAQDENIELRKVVIKGQKDGRKKKDIQEISRHTMTAEELKHVPASFGDAITALTALPGIMKEGGFIFGNLIIRGADVTTNNYYLDDMPIYEPMHFGGLHSVINTNFIDEIDIFASSFPANYGFATSGVINITSVDDIKEFGGFSDIGIISVSSMIQTPILKDKNGDFIYDPISIPGVNAENENAGYFIASGRFAFLKLAVELAEFIQRTEDDTSTFDFRYWDYQAKAKYYLNKANSVTLLFIGSNDFFTFNAEAETMNDDEEGEVDPIFQNARIKFRYEYLSHNQAIYYDFKPSKKIKNKLFFYSNLNERTFKFATDAVGAAAWLRDFNNRSRPWIFAVHDKAELKWLMGHATLRLGVGHTFYRFGTKTKIVIPLVPVNEFDINNPNHVFTYEINEIIKNHVTSGYIENKFSIFGFSTLLGVRSDYLKRTKEVTLDPRIIVSYKFSTDTTVSAAGGKYSYFFQTNPFIYNQTPDWCKLGKEFPSEKAIHRTIGVEQEFNNDLSVKLEGFYNNFYDKPIQYAHYREVGGPQIPALSTRKLRTYGFEILLKKDIKQGQDGFFGWLSYTYTQSKEKSGLPTEDGYLGLEVVDDDGNPIPVNYAGDTWGDRWVNSDFDLRHTLKLVAGYTYARHTFSGKLQVYAWNRYTPITGHIEDEDYALDDPDKNRYTPIYGKRNSSHNPPTYQLDLRYSYKINYSWGFISWYIEALYVKWFDRVLDEFDIDLDQTYEVWDYERPYEPGVNPRVVKEEESPLSFLPNFGVEIRF